MILAQFRSRYPQGSLISELLTIHNGKYLVRAVIQIDGITLATGIAAADTPEQAEDRARERALAILNLDEPSAIVADNGQTPPSLSEIIKPPKASANADPVSKPPHSSKTAVPEPAPLDEPLLLEQTPFSQSQAVTPTPSPTLLTPSNTAANPDPVTKFPQSAKPAAVEPAPLDEPLLLELATESEEDSLSPDFDEPILEPLAEEAPSEPDFSESPSSELLDFSEVIARSNVEMKRLKWTQEQGRNYLLQTYGKRSRQLLSDEELLEFLHYLEGLPTL